MGDQASQLQHGIAVIKQAVAAMQATAGVYKMLGVGKAVLYVGKAKNLPKRVISYANVSALPQRLRLMVLQLQEIEILTTETESQALLLEAHLIKTLHPRFNIDFKDDKSYPYIYADSNHEFPRLLKYRGKQRPQGNYFGPFASAQKVEETLSHLHKAFRLRNCSDGFFSSRTRPCLQYQIKRCSAPCVQKISPTEYNKTFQDALNFLSGKSTKVQQELARAMQEASDKMEYEKAIVLRDKIQALTKIQSNNIFSLDAMGDADVMVIHQNDQGACCILVFFIRGTNNFGHKAFFPNNAEDMPQEEIMSNFLSQFYQTHAPPRNIYVNTAKLSQQQLLGQALSEIAGHKVHIKQLQSSKQATLLTFISENAKRSLEEHLRNHAKIKVNLEAVQRLFGLQRMPKRIEVYDNSHLQGTNAVGCMVVAGLEGFDKKQYRQFKIKQAKTAAQGGDDYAMLQEVLRRRLAKLNEENKPDLLLIDGGKGHLSAAIEVIFALNLDEVLKVVCIAKGRDRNAGREWFFQIGQEPFQLPENHPTLSYLQILRDEAHRYAITTHRNLRQKQMRQSVIDNIPSIGASRKRALLSIFTSPEALREASVEEIGKTPGINKKLAKLIHDYLHISSTS